MLILWSHAVWNLFHVMSCNIKKKYFEEIKDEFLDLCVQICYNLPCGFCRMHATKYMNENLNKNEIKNRNELILFFFNFHNTVNESKKGSLYKENKLRKYKKFKTMETVDNLESVLKTYFRKQELEQKFSDWKSRNISKFKKRE